MNLKHQNPTKYLYTLIMVKNHFTLATPECIDEIGQLIPIVNVNYSENNLSLLELTLNKRCYLFADKMLSYGANPNINCQNGYPLLFKYAISGDHMAAVTLLKNDVDSSILTSDGKDFMELARIHSQIEFIDCVSDFLKNNQKQSMEIDSYTWE